MEQLKCGALRPPKDSDGGDVQDLVLLDVERIEKELGRIRERIAGAPRLEVTALYAAQQALQWALCSNSAASPFETITLGMPSGAGGCSARYKDGLPGEPARRSGSEPPGVV